MMLRSSLLACALLFLAGAARADVEPRPVYPWVPTSSEALDGRFAAPPGFTRSAARPGSFGGFLRALPLQPAGAPVVDYRGQKLHEDGRHPNIVAVADLDIGTKDLQQCADAIVRLHAEWRYGRGERDLSYRSVSGQSLSYRGWLAGERGRADGNRLVFQKVAAPREDSHAVFRAWLDAVFAWAGTPSVERDGKKIALADVEGGDFFVMTGAPFGHAVLVLDVARDTQGRTAVLLGQSYMPAQSFQVLRPREGSTWFVIEPGAATIETPFWKPFPLGSLRRL